MTFGSRPRSTRRADVSRHRGAFAALRASPIRLSIASCWRVTCAFRLAVAAFAEGAQAQGGDVTYLGLTSTDMLYYSSGKLHAPGAVFTASHNPAQYNHQLCLAAPSPSRRVRAVCASKTSRRA